MPEIGEVARIVHYVEKHLAGKTIAAIKAQHDENVFGKVGTTAAAFEKALKDKKIKSAFQQGKYWGMIMESPPHPLFHFGMTGWFKIRGVETAYYKPDKPEGPEWPPKYWKFSLETAEKTPCEAAFVDFRRFARIRLLDCAEDDIRQTSPLAENGPDPVIDKDILTEEWLLEKVKNKKIPIKAYLLDQANISGIGNWVGDEILYHAAIHPEQYTNSLSDAQIKQLHTSIDHVCSLAVDVLSDSSKFPEEWLFKHRWGKGKKDAPNKLPNGAKIVFLIVGGRTSAVVPSVQKKTGPVAAEIKDDAGETGHSEYTVAAANKAKSDSKSAKRKKDMSSENVPETILNGRREDTEKDQISKPISNKRSRKSKEEANAESNGRTKSIVDNANGPSTDDIVGREPAPEEEEPSTKPGAKTKTPRGKNGQRRSARVSGQSA